VLTAFSFAMLVALAWGWQHESDALRIIFIGGSRLTLINGRVLALVTFPWCRELLKRDGFLLVIQVWTVRPVYAALPLLDLGVMQPG
jgi:trk system potassium uptake protein TrkH